MEPISRKIMNGGDARRRQSYEYVRAYDYDYAHVYSDRLVLQEVRLPCSGPLEGSFAPFARSGQHHEATGPPQENHLSTFPPIERILRHAPGYDQSSAAAERAAY